MSKPEIAKKTIRNSRSTPAVSVIIAVYNHPDFLVKVLAGLRNQTFRNFEVLIADDGSGPDMAILISREQSTSFFSIRHIRHEHDGFRKTIIVNEAVAASLADYLVFLDGDCIPHHRFVESHYRYRSGNTVLSGRRVMLDQSRSATVGTDDIATFRLEQQSYWWNHCPRSDRKHGMYLRWGSLVENYVRRKDYSILGCNFSLHKTDFIRVNGYDENIIGRGMEDNNLDARLRLEHLRVKSVTREAIVFHLYHSSDPVPFNQETRIAMNNPSHPWARLGFDRHFMNREKQQTPTASVIIAVYNQPLFLENVLISLLRQSFNDFEIIIADDGSGPAVKEVLARYANSFRYQIQHVWHPDDGFRKTIIANQAVIRSRAPYLIFIDGDCLCHHRFVERHLLRGKTGTVLSGRRVHYDQKLTEKLTRHNIHNGDFEQFNYWHRHCRQGDWKHGIFLCFSTPLENAFRSCWPILGSNFSLFKQDFVDINGYDERIIGRGMEDSNLYERFKKKGTITRTIVREALQYHQHHTFDPIPHNADSIRHYCFPSAWWSTDGLIKGDRHEDQGLSSR